MTQGKSFRTFQQQVALLQERGLIIEDHARAERLLAQFNYYRLSGYWYPMRVFPSGSKRPIDQFKPGASFDLSVKLYEFDERLRHAVFSELDRVEMAIRTMLGYELGKLDPHIHTHSGKLNTRAGRPNKDGRIHHDVWMDKYRSAASNSKEDFVQHHKRKYGGEMPIWVAVEIMDWGMLSHLYGMSPGRVRNTIASKCQLNAAQLESWLKSLNIVRNYAAHHARMFNRSYDIRPKLSNDPCLVEIENATNRCFGQLTLVQYLHRKLELSPANILPSLMETFPQNDIVPFSRIGAPTNWRELTLWSTTH